MGLLLAGCASTTPAARSSSPPEPARLGDAGDAASGLAQIERSIGGRVGVYALDVRAGRSIEHRADERFAMCSTFKWLLAAAALARVDAGAMKLDDEIAYTEADLLEYAPITRAHVGEGKLSVAALAEAIVTVSDNTAANLLLSKVGGPPGLTAFLREHGDDVTRLDRDEPALSTNLPGDPRDTTSPRAMVGSMRSILMGDALTPPSRARLVGWLRGCTTGDARLRAGIPSGWTVGDKTGTGSNGACNDVAILEAPSGATILVASYLSESVEGVKVLEGAHQRIARLVAAALGPALASGANRPESSRAE